MLASSFLTRVVIALGIAGGLALVPACGDDDECDPSECLAGNQCLRYQGKVACRRPCSSNFDSATNCPFGATCVAAEPGVTPFCVPLTGRPLTQNKEKGQWGAPCAAQKGIEADDCDVAQGFFCYGQSPTDGDAYCTRYECAADTDCGPGFWCATVNETPNVERAKRTTIGGTVRVCKRREFCEPCTVDLDCPAFKGTKQHCITDAAGFGMCTPECQNAGNCPSEANCADAGIGVKICYPRATVCLGDGALCAPCRSDIDCGEDGICVKGQFTTERSCAKRSTSSCNEGQEQGSCAEKLASPNVIVRCLGGLINEVEPDFCHGVYLLGSEGGGDLGCWTPSR